MAVCNQLTRVSALRKKQTQHQRVKERYLGKFLVCQSNLRGKHEYEY